MYMAVLMFFACLYRYVGSGPLWVPEAGDLCKKNWWTNLLYVNNLVNVEGMVRPLPMNQLFLTVDRLYIIIFNFVNVVVPKYWKTREMHIILQKRISREEISNSRQFRANPN